MDAQTLFFTLASIFLILGIVLMLSGLAVVAYVFFQVRRAKERLEKLAEEKKFLHIVPFIIKGVKWIQDRRRD